MFYQDLLNRQESLSTGEGPQSDDMSYLGYSITSGDYTGDGIEDIAVGMPRGNQLRGKVVVMDDRLNVLYNITGEQVKGDGVTELSSVSCYANSMYEYTSLYHFLTHHCMHY